jgi:two-component system, response regulator, stage 0 sporulation protein F
MTAAGQAWSARAPARDRRPEGEEGAREMAQGARVLVVDDDAEMRALLRDELVHDGYEVTEAADGGEAVLACRGCAFDVIVMDKNMPGPSGLDLLPGFRRSCPGSRIIMMTAFGDMRSYAEAVEKGAVDFLFKPFRIDELKAAIHRALDMERPRLDGDP